MATYRKQSNNLNPAAMAFRVLMAGFAIMIISGSFIMCYRGAVINLKTGAIEYPKTKSNE